MDRRFRAALFAAALCAVSACRAQLPQPPGADRLKDLTAEWECPRRTALGPFHNLYNARVVRVPDRKYPYRMWFFGWPVADNNPMNGRFIGDAIYHARSADLERWEVYAGHDIRGGSIWVASNQPAAFYPVVSGLDAGSTEAIAGDPAVALRDGKYYMAFSSVWFESHPETTPQHLYLIPCIMGATSRDGINWTRTTKPILIWEKEYTIRQDVAGGNPVRPDNYYGSYHRPALMWDGNRWRIWFDYYKPRTFACMGVAENRGDFMAPGAWKLVRSGDQPAMSDWVNPTVVKVGNEYISFSDAAGYPPQYGNDGRLITMAKSTDGLAWQVLGHLRPEGMASSHVPEAFVQRDGTGEWLYLFYAYKPETVAGKEWDYRYKEVRWMRKRIGAGK